MSLVGRVFWVVSSITIVVLLFAWHSGQLGDLASLEDPYQPSDEILSPYAISKNPYLFKGRSGVLDTQHVPIVGSPLKGMTLAYPGGGLQFEKMIDEHTATYSVLVGTTMVMPGGDEIAVELPNNEPPDASRPWRVYVIGPTEGVNGLGHTITVSTVRFEGYYEGPLHAAIPIQPPNLPSPPIQQVATTMKPEKPSDIDAAGSKVEYAALASPSTTNSTTAAIDLVKESDAVQAFRKSCENGFSDSCANLARLYDTGDEVPHDFQKAASFYRKACDLGATEVCSKVQAKTD